MILALWVWLMVAEPPAAGAPPESRVFVLKNGVEVHPLPDGIAFIQNGKTLHRYTFRELGGEPSEDCNPYPSLPYIKEFSTNVLYLQYCLEHPSVEAPSPKVACYFTSDGVLTWCVRDTFTGGFIDSLGRYWVRVWDLGMFKFDAFSLYSASGHRIFIEGRGRYWVTYGDSSVVFTFIEPEKPEEPYPEELRRQGVTEILAIVFRRDGIGYADTFLQGLFQAGRVFPKDSWITVSLRSGQRIKELDLSSAKWNQIADGDTIYFNPPWQDTGGESP